MPTPLFNDALRRAREHAGLTQADVARAIGLNQTAISAWENRSTTITPEIAFVWVHLYRQPPGELLYLQVLSHGPRDAARRAA